MTSAPGRSASAAPGSTSFAPRMPAPITTCGSADDARVDVERPVGRDADRGDAAVLHPGQGDRVIHRGEARLAGVEQRAHDAVHVGRVVARIMHAAYRVDLAAAAGDDHAVRRDVEADVVRLAERGGVGERRRRSARPRPRRRGPARERRGDRRRQQVGAGERGRRDRGFPSRGLVSRHDLRDRRRSAGAAVRAAARAGRRRGARRHAAGRHEAADRAGARRRARARAQHRRARLPRARDRRRHRDAGRSGSFVALSRMRGASLQQAAAEYAARARSLGVDAARARSYIDAARSPAREPPGRTESMPALAREHVESSAGRRRRAQANTAAFSAMRAGRSISG